MAGASVAVLVALAGAAFLLRPPSAARPGAPAADSPSSPPAAAAALLVDGHEARTGAALTAAWDRPLVLTAQTGELVEVRVGDGADSVAGTLTPAGWTASDRLVPSRDYQVRAVLHDLQGIRQEVTLTLRTPPPVHTVSPALLPDGGSYGVGQPLVLRLDRAVTAPGDRAALLTHLRVSATPTVTGTWRFFNSHEVHYHPAHYWASGTVVRASADLSGLRLAGTGTWGSPTVHTTSFTIGPSVVSTVDLTAHTMQVVRNGTLLRTLPVSAGRDKYPTKGGVHVVLSVEREQLYNSATVGIPTASSDGYYEKLPYSMRISNGGAFVHANPATVAVQGRRNVSHGCVNLSLADAAWFYSVSHLGDIVDVVHAVVPPVRGDEGMFDWN